MPYVHKPIAWGAGCLHKPCMTHTSTEKNAPLQHKHELLDIPTSHTQVKPLPPDQRSPPYPKVTMLQQSRLGSGSSAAVGTSAGLTRQLPCSKYSCHCQATNTSINTNTTTNTIPQRERGRSRTCHAFCQARTTGSEADTQHTTSPPLPLRSSQGHTAAATASAALPSQHHWHPS